MKLWIKVGSFIWTTRSQLRQLTASQKAYNAKRSEKLEEQRKQELEAAARLRAEEEAQKLREAEEKKRQQEEEEQKRLQVIDFKKIDWLTPARVSSDRRPLEVSFLRTKLAD